MKIKKTFDLFALVVVFPCEFIQREEAAVVVIKNETNKSALANDRTKRRRKRGKVESKY
jgi:hypothetical protein